MGKGDFMEEKTGFYYDGNGKIRNLSSGETEYNFEDAVKKAKGRHPFNGNFFDGDGNIKNIEELSGSEVSKEEFEQLKGEVAEKLEQVRLVTDGNTITLNGVVQNFDDIYNLVMDNSKYIYIVMDENIRFRPSAYDGTAIWFDSTFIELGSPNILRCIINAENRVSISQYEVEILDRKVTEITDSNKNDTTKYTSVKAVTDYSNSKSEITSLLNNKFDKSGGAITGDLSVNGTTTIGNAIIQYDSTNNCLNFNFNNISSISTLSLEDEVVE